MTNQDRNAIINLIEIANDYERDHRREPYDDEVRVHWRKIREICNQIIRDNPQFTTEGLIDSQYFHNLATNLEPDLLSTIRGGLNRTPLDKLIGELEKLGEKLQPYNSLYEYFQNLIKI